MAHNMLHVIDTWCVAHDFLTIVPWPLEHMCWRQFVELRGDCEKSRTAPLNAVIIIIIIIIIVSFWRQVELGRPSIIDVNKQIK